jgi:hypothetical protein
LGLRAGVDAGVEVLRHALPSNGVLYAQPLPASIDLSRCDRSHAHCLAAVLPVHPRFVLLHYCCLPSGPS